MRALRSQEDGQGLFEGAVEDLVSSCVLEVGDQDRHGVWSFNGHGSGRAWKEP